MTRGGNSEYIFFNFLYLAHSSSNLCAGFHKTLFQFMGNNLATIAVLYLRERRRTFVAMIQLDSMNSTNPINKPIFIPQAGAMKHPVPVS